MFDDVRALRMWLKSDASVDVIATVSVFAIAQGLSYPLLSFILQRQGVSPASACAASPWAERWRAGPIAMRRWCCARCGTRRCES